MLVSLKDINGASLMRLLGSILLVLVLHLFAVSPQVVLRPLPNVGDAIKVLPPRTDAMHVVPAVESPKHFLNLCDERKRE